MTSRAGATKAQMAPLCRDSQQLWREAGPLLQQLEPPTLALGTFIQEEPTGQSRVSLGTVTWPFIPTTVSGPCARGSHVSQLWKEFCRFADWLREKGFYRHSESGALLLRALRLPRVSCLQRSQAGPRLHEDFPLMRACRHPVLRRDSFRHLRPGTSLSGR